MSSSRKKWRCRFFMPMRFGDLTHRQRPIERALACTRAAILSADQVLEQPDIHVHINGVQQWREALQPSLVTLSASLAPFIPTYSVGAASSKPLAVNRGLADARAEKYDLFFCIDDDIAFESTAFRQMIETFRSHRCDVVTCVKLPLTARTSTPFQVVHSHFFDVLFHLGIGPKRPTGSLYCVDPTRVLSVPLQCNEGDFLSRCRTAPSGVIVVSELSRTFDEEISRRARLRCASEAIGFQRFNDDDTFMHALLERALRDPGLASSKRFLTSADLYFKILSRLC